MSHVLKFIFASLMFTIVLYAESNLYTPKEMNEAVSKGTRTLDGIPRS